MPIKIPDSLPAKDILEQENIFVMTEYVAMHQDIRPLQLLILNLMPTKIVTETQLLRKLSNTPLQIEIEFIHASSHKSKNTDPQHLSTFYTVFEDIKDKCYDGMVITGAPVEKLPFEEVDYWSELCQIMEWSKQNVHSTFHICWGAQAGLYYHYGIDKHPLPQKLSGIYEHTPLNPQSPFFRGFNDTFHTPHSCYTYVREEDVQAIPELEVMAVSEKAGIFGAKSSDNRRFFILGHPEYDADTLANEYFRDIEKGIPTDVPENYFPDDNPAKPPIVSWRAHSQLLYSNWLNYYVYQTMPYDIRQIREMNR